jgi:hypothetical protein
MEVAPRVGGFVARPFPDPVRRWAITLNAALHSAKGRLAGLASRPKKAADRALDWIPTIQTMQDSGFSLRQRAAGLNEKGFKTARGGDWGAAESHAGHEAVGRVEGLYRLHKGNPAMGCPSCVWGTICGWKAVDGALHTQSIQGYTIGCQSMDGNVQSRDGSDEHL